VLDRIGDDDMRWNTPRVCADVSPHYCPAWFNLGHLYDERGESNAPRTASARPSPTTLRNQPRWMLLRDAKASRSM